MIELLEFAFMHRALLGGLGVAIACAMIGPSLVLRRLSLLGDGLAHLAFGGVALGMLIGIDPFLAAMAVVIIGAWGVQKLIKTHLYGDAAVAVILSVGVGIGVILLGIADGFGVDLFSFLIGSILALRWMDVGIIWTGVIAATVAVTIMRKHLLLTSFNPEIAQLTSARFRIQEAVFTLLTAIVVVLSIRAVGILLVSALIVIPAISGLALGRSFTTTHLYTIAVSILGVLIGIITAFYTDIPPSGAIVMATLMLYIIALVMRR